MIELEMDLTKRGSKYLESIDMKFLTSDFCWVDNSFSGRYTDMVCNKVHEPRPISLTSGGHSLALVSFFGPTFINDLKSVQALHGFSRLRSYSILYLKVMQLLSFLHFCLQICRKKRNISKNSRNLKNSFSISRNENPRILLRQRYLS